MYRIFITSVFLISCCNLNSQILRGTISDAKGSTLSNASIYVDEIGIGTISNDNAAYELDLRGINECRLIIRHLGYETLTIEVKVKKDTVINFEMISMNYALSDVTIIGNNEDFAKEVMKKVIAKSPYYQRAVDSFQVDLYMKGKAKLYPPKKLGFIFEDSKVDSSRLYIHETLNRLKYERPNNITE